MRCTRFCYYRQRYIFKLIQIDLILFLKEIYLSFYEYADSSGITCQFSAPEGTLKCWFDPEQMKKVFYNLLSNAFKYSKTNATIEVVVTDTGSEIQIKIIDNGIGIDKKHIDNIFDRFYQVDNTAINPANSPGTGIGLSLTKSIVEMHRGYIRVKSAYGYGSIFIIHLPKGKDRSGESDDWGTTWNRKSSCFSQIMRLVPNGALSGRKSTLFCEPL